MVKVDTCVKKLRKDIETEAARVLGRPHSSWKRLDKKGLCRAISKKKSSPKGQKRKSSPKRKVGGTLVERRLAIRNNFFNMKSKYRKVRKVGTGVQGVAWLCETDKITFVKKESAISSEDRRIAAVKNHLDEGIEKLLQYKTARGAEFVAEMIGAHLASQLTEQNICPHFPLVYGCRLVKENRSYHMETMMEAVPGAETLEKWGQNDHTEAEWISVIFQIMIALDTLTRQYGISHRDLHTENILMYKLGKEWNDGYFAYTVPPKTFYVPVHGYMVCIIDYGRVRMFRGKEVEIGWHERVLNKKKRFKDWGKYGTYDIRQIISNMREELDAMPKFIDVDVLSNIRTMLVKNYSLLEVLLLFSKDLHGEHCADGQNPYPCYDIKPKLTRSTRVAHFDLSRRVQMPKGESWKFLGDQG